MSKFKIYFKSILIPLLVGAIIGFITSGSNGIGTKSIRHAVENNHGFVNYSIEGGFFVATVVLPVSLNV